MKGYSGGNQLKDDDEVYDQTGVHNQEISLHQHELFK